MVRVPSTLVEYNEFGIGEERVTTGGKGRVEIEREIGKVTGMVADAHTTDNLGKR
jgi:hypothetical protein